MQNRSGTTKTANHPIVRRLCAVILFLSVAAAVPFIFSFINFGIYYAGRWLSAPAERARYDQCMQLLDADVTRAVEVGEIIDGVHVPNE